MTRFIASEAILVVLEFLATLFTPTSEASEAIILSIVVTPTPSDIDVTPSDIDVTPFLATFTPSNIVVTNVTTPSNIGVTGSYCPKTF